MATISVLGDLNLNVTETFTSPADPGDATITFNGWSEDGITLTANSTVPATKYTYTSAALSSGALTIDLAALPGRSSDQTVVGTGLRVQFVRLKNPSTNANNLTFAKGASNGYTGLGSAFSCVLKPGQSALFYLADGGPDVSGSDKTIDVTGTASQVVQYAIVLG